MAASTSSPLHCHTRFDIFLSFRGEDTRHSFTDHLYAALNRAGIRTFRDNDEIERGEDLGHEIVKAIKESKAFIVILSENYAKSRWCLEELALILEQRRNFNQFVLPVFYGVDPSDVRNQRHNFVIDVEDGVQGSKWSEDNVNRWKVALTEVANFAGMVVLGSETNFITEVVDTVNHKIDLKVVSTPSSLTGMETRAEGINSWLNDEQSDAHVLAICGMGGSGKTTLAQHIYNSNKQNFESSSFLEDIGKHNKQPYGLLKLQKQLLTDILGGENKTLSSVSIGTSKIEEALQTKRVLIVLDDIDEHDELSALLGTNTVHTQSKIIITTRLLDIRAWFGSISWKCRVHKLKLLNARESLELFSCHAFGSKVPIDEFKDLAVKLAQYCGGNPLALKVLGCSLFVSAEEDPQNINNIIQVWRSRLNSLSSLKGDLDFRIKSVLQKSFDSLPLACYRELFLHIAIFFIGEDEDYVVNILEHDWHAKSGIMTLINRCLLTVSPRKKLRMHQLLQDMARNLVREESKDPEKHTRVWCSDEAYHVLTNGEGSKTIEGLTLDTRKLKKGTKVLAVKTRTLAKMDKLKFLQLKYVEVCGSYKNFPELRWLSWHGCHLRTLPSGLSMSSLVALDMSHGNLENFDPPMVLNSLKILNLEACKKLVSIRNLHRLPNLETLSLWYCKRLSHVCKTIGNLENLSLLNLADCRKLWKVSFNQKPLLPQSIKFLFLDYCNIEHNNNVPVEFHNQSLSGLSLSGNIFESLPTNIDLKMLRVLNLDSCKNLKSLLCLPSTLQELYAYRCESLEKITFQSARFRLQKFGFKGCFKLSEIQGLFKLVSIEKVGEATLGHMQWEWIKAYQDQTVDLIGYDLTKSRNWRTQMLYEYGITSTYLQGTLKEQSMPVSQFMTSDYIVFFRVPFDPKIRMIQGLNITVIYKSVGLKEKEKWLLFIKVCNTSKGLTFIYNPVVYCKPMVDEDVVWLSYWPIGNMLDIGDEIYVDVVVENGLMVTTCGASLMYTDVGEKNSENNTKTEEVIGGDLSEFEVAAGVYYLCRRDLIFDTKSMISSWLKALFDHDMVRYTQLQRWRKSHQWRHLDRSFMELVYNMELYRDTLYKEIWLGSFNGESEIRKITKAISRLEGVDLVDYDIEKKKMYVCGLVDYMAVETCVREFDKTVTIFNVEYKVDRLLKRIHKKVAFQNPKNAFRTYFVWYLYSTRKEFF